MKIEDFKKVEFLVKLRANLTLAILQCDDYQKDEPEVDAGGLCGFDTGYWSAIAQHKEGSGQIVDMTGCYVQEQVVAATRVILINQRQDVLDTLTNLGVDISDG